MTRIILTGGSYRTCKSEAGRAIIEAARELGYNIVEVGPGITGRIADAVILDELKHLQDIPPHKLKEEMPTPFAPSNRKARRAARSKRKQRKAGASLPRPLR